MQDARSKNIEDVLILSGDHLYRMDYMDFVQVRLKMPSRTNLYLLLRLVLIQLLYIGRIIGKVVQISLFLVCQWTIGEWHLDVFFWTINLKIIVLNYRLTKSLSSWFMVNFIAPHLGRKWHCKSLNMRLSSLIPYKITNWPKSLNSWIMLNIIILLLTRWSRKAPEILIMQSVQTFLRL